MADPLRKVGPGAESSLPGDKLPPGSPWTAARPGSSLLALDWYVVFKDITGATVPGGSATIQWYAIEFDGESVNTPTVGAAQAVGDLEIKRVFVGPGLYAWPLVVSQTPPSIPPKATQVQIFDDGDGTYSIAVVGEEEPYEYEASGASLADITTGLATLFSGHPTLSVVEAGEGFLLFGGSVDFELVLSSPDDTMEQDTYVPYKPPIGEIWIYAAPSTGAAVSADIDTDLMSSLIADALQDAGATSSDTYQQVLAALTYAGNNGPIATAAQVAAVGAAVGSGVTKMFYGGSFSGAGAALESTLVSDGSPSSRIAIYGFWASGGATAIDVELCSGAPADTTSLGGPAKGKCGAGAVIAWSSSDPLWYTPNSRGVVIKRSSDQPIQCFIRYAYADNA